MPRKTRQHLINNTDSKGSNGQPTISQGSGQQRQAAGETFLSPQSSKSPMHRGDKLPPKPNRASNGTSLDKKNASIASSVCHEDRFVAVTGRKTTSNDIEVRASIQGQNQSYYKVKLDDPKSMGIKNQAAIQGNQKRGRITSNERNINGANTSRKSKTRIGSTSPQNKKKDTKSSHNSISNKTIQNQKSSLQDFKAVIEKQKENINANFRKQAERQSAGPKLKLRDQNLRSSVESDRDKRGILTTSVKQKTHSLLEKSKRNGSSSKERSDYDSIPNKRVDVSSKQTAKEPLHQFQSSSEEIHQRKFIIEKLSNQLIGQMKEALQNEKSKKAKSTSKPPVNNEQAKKKEMFSPKLPPSSNKSKQKQLFRLELPIKKEEHQLKYLKNPRDFSEEEKQAYLEQERQRRRKIGMDYLEFMDDFQWIKQPQQQQKQQCSVLDRSGSDKAAAAPASIKRKERGSNRESQDIDASGLVVNMPPIMDSDDSLSVQPLHSHRYGDSLQERGKFENAKVQRIQSAKNKPPRPKKQNKDLMNVQTPASHYSLSQRQNHSLHDQGLIPYKSKDQQRASRSKKRKGGGDSKGRKSHSGSQTKKSSAERIPAQQSNIPRNSQNSGSTKRNEGIAKGKKNLPLQLNNYISSGSTQTQAIPSTKKSKPPIAKKRTNHHHVAADELPLQPKKRSHSRKTPKRSPSKKTPKSKAPISLIGGNNLKSKKKRKKSDKKSKSKDKENLDPYVKGSSIKKLGNRTQRFENPSLISDEEQLFNRRSHNDNQTFDEQPASAARKIQFGSHIDSDPNIIHVRSPIGVVQQQNNQHHNYQPNVFQYQSNNMPLQTEPLAPEDDNSKPQNLMERQKAQILQRVKKIKESQVSSGSNISSGVQSPFINFHPHHNDKLPQAPPSHDGGSSLNESVADEEIKDQRLFRGVSDVNFQPASLTSSNESPEMQRILEQNQKYKDATPFITIEKQYPSDNTPLKESSRAEIIHALESSNKMSGQQRIVFSAAVFIQKHVRGFLDRLRITRMKLSHEIDVDFSTIRHKYGVNSNHSSALVNFGKQDSSRSNNLVQVNSDRPIRDQRFSPAAPSIEEKHSEEEDKIQLHYSSILRQELDSSQPLTSHRPDEQISQEHRYFKPNLDHPADDLGQILHQGIRTHAAAAGGMNTFTIEETEQEYDRTSMPGITLSQPKISQNLQKSSNENNYQSDNKSSTLPPFQLEASSVVANNEPFEAIISPTEKLLQQQEEPLSSQSPRISQEIKFRLRDAIIRGSNDAYNLRSSQTNEPMIPCAQQFQTEDEFSPNIEVKQQLNFDEVRESQQRAATQSELEYQSYLDGDKSFPVQGEGEAEGEGVEQEEEYEEQEQEYEEYEDGAVAAKESEFMLSPEDQTPYSQVAYDLTEAKRRELSREEASPVKQMQFDQRSPSPQDSQDDDHYGSQGHEVENEDSQEIEDIIQKSRNEQSQEDNLDNYEADPLKAVTIESDAFGSLTSGNKLSKDIEIGSDVFSQNNYNSNGNIQTSQYQAFVVSQKQSSIGSTLPPATLNSPATSGLEGSSSIKPLVIEEIKQSDNESEVSIKESQKEIERSMQDKSKEEEIQIEESQSKELVEDEITSSNAIESSRSHRSEPIETPQHTFTTHQMHPAPSQSDDNEPTPTQGVDSRLHNLIDQKLEAHKQNETAKINKLYRQKKISPRSYQSKRQNIEKWVESEKKIFLGSSASQNSLGREESKGQLFGSQMNSSQIMMQLEKDLQNVKFALSSSRSRDQGETSSNSQLGFSHGALGRKNLFEVTPRQKQEAKQLSMSQMMQQPKRVTPVGQNWTQDSVSLSKLGNSFDSQVSELKTSEKGPTTQPLLRSELEQAELNIDEKKSQVQESQESLNLDAKPPSNIELLDSGLGQFVQSDDPPIGNRFSPSSALLMEAHIEKMTKTDNELSSREAMSPNPIEGNELMDSDFLSPDPSQKLTLDQLQTSEAVGNINADLEDAVQKPTQSQLSNSPTPSETSSKFFDSSNAPKIEYDSQSLKEKQVEQITEELFSKMLGECFTLSQIAANKPSLPHLTQEEFQAFQQQQQSLSQISDKGIDTSNNRISRYIDEILNRIKKCDKYQEEFRFNINTPLHKDPLEILGHLQNAEVAYDVENMPFQQSVLSVDLYLDIETRRKKKEDKLKIIREQRDDFDLQLEDISSDEEDPDIDAESLIAEWENIHNKVIFDAVNEALDSFRPFGLKGPPLPWTNQKRSLLDNNNFKSIKEIIEQVRKKVIQWCQIQAGTIHTSNEFILRLRHFQTIYGLSREEVTDSKFIEERLNNFREEKLGKFLTTEVEESETLWVDYEYEETQTKLDLADMVLEQLCKEFVVEYKHLTEKRKDLSEIACQRMAQDLQDLELGDNESDVSQVGVSGPTSIGIERERDSILTESRVSLKAQQEQRLKQQNDDL